MNMCKPFLAGLVLLLCMPAADAAAPPASKGSAESQAGNNSRSLWIAKFECDTKAAQAVASTQHADADALQYSNLFTAVTTFSTQPSSPAGAWTLTGKELDYSGGSTAARALVGWGAGRAHLIMEYDLHDPSGKIVWTKKLKTEPSFWGSSGALGSVQNQGAASQKQGQDLVDALAKFLQEGKAPAGTR